jgi:molybdopterin-guanine dinucleotide biosynthesis protein A
MNIIVLTGGTSKRFGSDKSQALINGKSLLQILTDGLTDLIIVGPVTSVRARYVQESPIGAGPLAAIGAGLEFVESDLVAIFATDMPFAPKVLPELERALKNDAALPIDSSGYLQPLAGLYKTSKLKEALANFETLENQSIRELINKLNVDSVEITEGDLLIDIDTEAELLKAIDLASRLAP